MPSITRAEAEKEEKRKGKKILNYRSQGTQIRHAISESKQVSIQIRPTTVGQSYVPKRLKNLLIIYENAIKNYFFCILCPCLLPTPPKKE
jgi:hypothetical protein